LAIANVETLLIQTALQHTHGRKHEAALLLGYGRNTLTRKLKELDIEE
jgi:two-component system nitrogen regulation response regulator GlnG